MFGLGERKGETLLMFAQYYARKLANVVYGIYNCNWGYYLNSRTSAEGGPYLLSRHEPARRASRSGDQSRRSAPS